MNDNQYIDGPVEIVRSIFPWYNYERDARFHGDRVLIEIRSVEVPPDAEELGLDILTADQARELVRGEDFQV